ncbi:hypothetical protein [Microbacterium sp. 2FI]|uniref:hypothetical protein n=1 Tax=Microbacterium sp. 2FI TaxID=2502193 RepID=UPI0010F6E742|nr:hypothetical protein [Microbacterium sp. 2FI]
MNSSMTFNDGEPIPFPSYRCTATARKAKSTYTHRCRQHVDHDGDHVCTCKMRWAKKAGV